MSSTRTIARSFAGGVIAPEMFGRVDLRGYQTGLQQCDNLVVLPHGPATKRPGFEFGFPIEIGTVTRARLIPFATSGDGVLVVMTETHVYFVRENRPVCLTAGAFTASGSTVTKNSHGYSNGDVVFLGTFTGGYPDVGAYYKVSAVATNTFTATALTGGATVPASGSCGKVYRLVAATDTALLKTARYSQSGQTLTFCTGATPPIELARTSDTSWAVSVPDFTTPTTPPDRGSSASSHGYLMVRPAAGVSESTDIKDTNNYLITKVSDTGEESIASARLARTYGGWSSTYSSTLTSAANGSDPLFTTSGNHEHIVGDRLVFRGMTGGTWGTNTDDVEVYVTAAPSPTTFKVVRCDTSAVFDSTSWGTLTSGRVYRQGARVDLTVAGDRIELMISTAAVSDAYRINVYKQDSRSLAFGYIATIDPALENTYDGFYNFFDDNIVPDITRSPPEDWNPFTGSGNYPLAVAHNEQRRIFGGTENEPQRVFMSPIGFEDSMAQHFPVLDSDAFDFTVAARVHHRIQHLVGIGDLLALTKNCEFQIKSGDGSAIGPSSVNARPQSYVGANDVQPVVSEAAVVFISASGERPYEVTYARDGSGGYVAVDLGIFTPHYFAGYTIVDLAYVRGEVPSLWAVRSDGALLSCTYLPGQEVRAWHKHTTDGTVQSVASVFEEYKDRLYISVVRDIDGTNVLIIERMADWTFDEIEDCQFRDSFASWSGTASDTVNNLWHLEGETVTALGDGKVFRDLTVSAGQITLPEECEKVLVGRAYTSRLKTLPLAFEIAGAGLGRPKNVSRAFLRVYKTSGVKAGPAFDDLVEYNEVPQNYGEPNALISSVIEVPLNTQWTEDGALCIESDDPRPLTIQAMSLEVTLGG